MSHPRKAGERSTSASQKTPSRLAISAVGAATMAFIAAEPYLFEAEPGMQAFQAALVFGIWLLFMFGTTAEPPHER